MRTHYMTGTALWIEYPDALVWLGDNNIIRVGSSNESDTVGARVVVREPTGNQLVLDYWSETSEIVFLLNDTLKQLYHDNLSAWDIMVEAYSNSSSQGTFLFQTNVYDGKSFPDRSHAATSTIYWTDTNELTKLQLFSYEGGTATIGTHSYPLNAGITSLNLSSLNLGDITNVHITSTTTLDTTPNYLGDAWNTNRMNTVSYDVALKNLSVCSNYNAVRIYYNDTDGCYRWIAGKLKKETDNAKGTAYTNITNIYRNGAYKLNTSTSKTITVTFGPIDSGAYFQDIMYANTVRMLNYNGDLIPVTVNTTKLTSEETESEYEIEFTINSEN